MDRGIIPIDAHFELEYRYYDRDTSFKYYNRKFEIYLIFKKGLRKNCVLHMDNCDTSEGQWAPHLHKPPQLNKKLYFGVSTLNWNDIKNNFADSIIAELGGAYKAPVKKAIGKLNSPKL
jgi:hypothetical protein